MTRTDATLSAYSGQADAYAKREIAERNRKNIELFMERLPAGARVLDLGCGAGWASQMMEAQEFDVFAVDGCAELAAIASERLKRPARELRFDELDYAEEFDGILANNVLHHVPKADLPTILQRVATALRPGGLLFASFKQGDGEGEDSLGRFYAYYQPDELTALFEAVPGLAVEDKLSSDGLDFAGVPRTFLAFFVRKQLDAS